MTLERAPIRPRRWHPALLIVCLALLGLAPGTSVAQQPLPDTEPDTEDAEPVRITRQGDMISIFGGELVVPAGTRQRGDLVCVGCRARIDGEVDGDVIVIMGSLELTGRVEGAVTTVLSKFQLRGAAIRGELVNVLGSLEMERTTVEREFMNFLGSLEQDTESSKPNVSIGFRSWDFWSFLLWFRLFCKLLAFCVVVLLVVVVPERVRTIGEQAGSRYPTAFFVGLLTYALMLLVLTLPFVGFPFGLLAFWVLKWLGVAGLFYAIGQRLGRAVGREMSVLGAVLLVFAAYLVVSLAPTALGVAGLLIWLPLWLVFFFLIEVPAIGLVVLTRIGGRSRQHDPPPAPAATYPGAAPARTAEADPT